MECSVCCEAFSEEGAHVPRNLDCGHTFCTLCIQRLDSHAPLRQGPKCPECRAVIRFNRRTATSLPKNFKLLELIREQGRERKAPSNGPLPVQEERPRHGMMFMGNYYRPIPEVMMYPIQPMHFASFAEDMHRLRISEATTSMPIQYPLPSPSPEGVPEAVENGRAVTAPNGTLVCKFFQEGTCRYGPHCWFRHTVLNPNASLCRHWMKGQCRMGLDCHYRHGTERCVPRRPPRRQQTQERDPAMPGPSGEGAVSHRRPSKVVFVSERGATVQRMMECQHRSEWGHVFNQAGAPPGLTSDSETFFDNFSSYR